MSYIKSNKIKKKKKLRNKNIQSRKKIKFDKRVVLGTG